MKLATATLTNRNAADVLAEGAAALAAGESAFDLSALTEVDTAAVAVLLAWQRQAQAAGRTLHLSGAPPALLSLASLYGVSSLLFSTPGPHATA
jgi:phospholipid transport system transporter-binding protein